MKRLRISPFQVVILRLIQKGFEYNGQPVDAAPSCGNFKEALYGRSQGFSTSERVTLHRSVRRLLANGMIEPGVRGFFGNTQGRYRLTKKGRAWLEAADAAQAAPPRRTS
jgi:hypothetical protein